MSNGVASLNLTKLVADGLKDGLSSVTSKVGEELVGYGLNAILGTKFGQSEQLAQIQSTLTKIDSSLTDLEHQLGSIMKQLSLSEQLLNINGLLNSVSQDQANIKTSWGYFVGYVQKGSITGVELKDLVGGILGTGNAMADSLTSIADVLMTNGQRKGLLDAWVDYAITSMQGTTPSATSIQSWFQYFENSLMLLVQQLYRGMILNVNALVVQGCQESCGDPESQGCQDCLLDSPGTSGTDYLNILFYPLLDSVMEQYVQSINRFLLRFYNPTTFTEQPQFLDNGLLNSIWTRVDLLTSLTIARPGTATNPGFCIRLYTVPNQVSNGAGPPISPSGFGTRNGKFVPPPGFYNGGPGMSNWYKCAYWSNSSTQALASFEQSDISMIEYHWDWGPSLPTVGQPLSGLPNVIPQYYNVCTMQQEQSESDETVVFASWTDSSPILDQCTMGSSYSWGFFYPSYATTHNTKQTDIFSGVWGSFEQSTLTMSCGVTVLYNVFGSASYVSSMNASINYSGSDTEITAILMGTYSSTVGPQNPNVIGSKFTPPANVVISASAGTSQSTNTFLNSTNNNNNPSNPQTSTGSIATASQKLALAENATSEIRLQISLNALYDTTMMLGHDKITTPLSASVTVNSARLAWSQPTLNVS